MDKRRKLDVQLAIASALVVVGCGLLIAGFYVPPLGEIHNSILIAFGEILTFTGSLFGIDYHYRYNMFQSHQRGKKKG